MITLDGVMQAPGGPEEDRSGGFAYGGWSFGYWDNMMGNIMNDFMSIPFELLLGKKTYDIFAGYWPTATQDQSVAKPFNSTKKYVVSDVVFTPFWNNSILVMGDVVPEIQNLKSQQGPDLWVHGSGKLIQTLLANHLIDRMYIWIFPVTVGNGKRLFAEGAQPEGFKLTDTKISTSGVIIATYEFAGPLKTGTIGQ